MRVPILSLCWAMALAQGKDGEARNESGSAGGGLMDTNLGLDPEEGPSAVHWALAAILGAALVSGLVQVYRQLHALDSLSNVPRHVPDGFRAAMCGNCHQVQYVSDHGRIFICFSCRSANRILRDIPRSEQQLVVPTGPLRSYEFRKGGQNYWQELSQRELSPSSPDEGSAGGEGGGEREGQDSGGGDAQLQQVRPQTLGRQQAVDSNADETISQRSARTDDEDGLPQCVVCLDNPGCMVLLPCAHGSVCEECATRIAQNRASGGAHCPHCRANIETLVKLRQLDGDVARGVELRIPMARASQALS